MRPIELKRIYEPASESDGYRVLVERLWPRGVSKSAARVNLWSKGSAPSAELRSWFEHDPKKWPEFRKRYFAELDDNPQAVTPLIERARRGKVTFVYASKEQRYNNAVALREYVEQRL